METSIAQAASDLLVPVVGQEGIVDFDDLPGDAPGGDSPETGPTKELTMKWG